MRKELLLLLILICCLKIQSQENRRFLYAVIKDSFKEIPNTHVINLNTNQGTITNDSGEFRILAKENDSLKISFIGYKTRFFIVKTSHFGMLKNNISLEKKIYELDEVSIKNNKLESILSRDLKQIPEDLSIVKSNGALDFSKINFKKSIIKIIDDVERSKAPNIWKDVDPTAKFFGIGGRFNTGSVKNANKLKKQRKNFKFKENFPKMLISEFGANFFYKDLKIPKEKYHHFLEYCNPLKIEELYKNGKVLEMIKILQQESKSYLKTINLQE